jgi:predicted CoA-binding protein
MKTVAVIGASVHREKFGNKALRAWRNQGYRVIPVNPTATIVEGEQAFASVLDYAGPIDEATMYVPPEIGLGVLDDIARKGIATVWLNPGADSPAVIARARELGLEVIVACSILGVGESPGAY